MRNTFHYPLLTLGDAVAAPPDPAFPLQHSRRYVMPSLGRVGHPLQSCIEAFDGWHTNLWPGSHEIAAAQPDASAALPCETLACRSQG